MLEGMETAQAYRLLIADVYELAAVSRRTSEVIAAAEGQTVARWHLLSVLSGGPMTSAAAARRLGLTRQSVHRVAHTLLADGLVETAANPDHKTAPLLSVTAGGHAALDSVVTRADRERGARLAAADISGGDLLRARAILRAVLAALNAQ